MSRISDIFSDARQGEFMFDLISEAFLAIEEQLDEIKESIENREEMTTEYIREILNDT